MPEIGRSVMKLEGNLRDSNLAEVLWLAGREKRTGILTIQGDQEIIGVSFLNGEVVSADALNQTLEEGLGEVLASRELVAAEELASLAAEHQAGGGRVMDLLVERSYLSRDDLLDALRYHTYRLCRQVLHWASGEFKFYRGEEVSYEEGVSPISAEELLICAAQDLGSQGPLPGKLPESDVIYTRVLADGKPRAGASFGAALPAEVRSEIDGEAGRVLEQVDGQASCEQILTACGLPKYKALMALYRLEQQGRIEAIGSAVMAPAAAVAQPAPAPASRSAPAPVATPKPAEPAKAPAPRKPPFWRRPQRERRGRATPVWPSRLLALGLAAVLFALLASQPSRFLLPFPWQGGLRQTLVDQQRATGYLKIDRAARTLFLLDGRFPEALSELTAEGLIHPEDLVDPQGRLLAYSALPAGYLLKPEGSDEPGSSRAVTVTGDFLLDPEFVVPELTEKPPLILLD